MCFFLSHSLWWGVAVHVFWVIVMLEYPSMTHFQCPAWLASMPWPWQYLAPSIVPLMQCSCPFPTAEHRQHSSSSKHSELSWCQRAKCWTHLTTTLSPSYPVNHWQTSVGPVHVLSWAGGPWLRALHDFSPSRRSVLPIVVLVTMVPAALRSLTRSSRAVLGWFLTVLMIIETPRGEILHGAIVRGRLASQNWIIHKLKNEPWTSFLERKSLETICTAEMFCSLQTISLWLRF